MQIKLVSRHEVSRAMKIIVDGKKYLSDHQVIQWQNGYPNEESLLSDIDKQCLYGVYEEEQLMAIAAIINEVEPTYNVIYEGEWLSTNPYLVIHRIAVSNDARNKGCASLLLNYAEQLANRLGITSIKVDTHPDNLSMNSLLLKHGYTNCGIIHLTNNKDSFLRYGYEKLL